KGFSSSLLSLYICCWLWMPVDKWYNLGKRCKTVGFQRSGTVHKPSRKQPTVSGQFFGRGIYAAWSTFPPQTVHNPGSRPYPQAKLKESFVDVHADAPYPAHVQSLVRARHS